MNEIWKSVPGFEGLYEISNCGRLNRLISRFRWKAGIYDGFVNSHGYRSVRLTKDGYTRTRPIHQLVCLAFIGPVPSGKEPNHLNGIKNDNRLDNLEYVTRSENATHACKLGLHKVLKGSSHWKAKLKNNDIVRIRELRSDGVSVEEIGNRFGVSGNYIYNICNKYRWAHVF